MAEGVRRAEASSFGARYLWFTDADIVHRPSSLRRLVAKAEGERRDLVSLMVLLDCRSAWDRLLVPAFVFFFQILYPFAWVNDPARREAGAAGGSMLVRTTALARAGGLAAVRSALIDDCALARAVKRGGAIWLGLSEDDRSMRPYEGLGGIWSMVARTAFDQLRYSALLLAGTVLGLALMFLAPPVIAVAAAAHGEAILAAYAAAIWAMLGFAWRPTLRLYRQPAWFGVLLPVSALLYTAMTIDSAWRHWRGKGGLWKGRAHRGMAHGR
jgi:hopene-associated glycosyltransferase HpnB